MREIQRSLDVGGSGLDVWRAEGEGISSSQLTRSIKNEGRENIIQWTRAEPKISRSSRMMARPMRLSDSHDIAGITPFSCATARLRRIF
ncbi:hypothetical protein ARMSODRAFT_954141 [Armillaria solidipes]|uniref:Uncharacterized protein n=1 Tax=Armillaria solidipes TaxID=1076256 RepID=A0A2H3BNI6_9AGAR|nr:hypothetical protein ARMSODRAFT_954141 [Armillaria solidipes]